MGETYELRGKTPHGNWVYGYFHKNLNDDAFILTAKGEFVVEESTVGRYTGIQDSNGNKIYNGDIIHIKSNTIDKDFGVVTWHENGYFFVDDSFGEFPRTGKPIGDFFNCIKSNEIFKGMEFYVNGNIFDNKQTNNGKNT